jgi:hypothetical protein
MMGSRGSLPALLAGLALLAIPSVGGANTGPVGEILVHVQPDTWPPPPPLTACDQLVQHTPDTGALEFDLYLTLNEAFAFGVDSLELTVQWTQGWNAWDYLIPSGGTGNVSVQGSQATFTVGWPACSTTDEGLLLLLRLYVDVSGPGELRVSGWTDVRMCEGWSGWLGYTEGFAASAGDICDYYSESCPPRQHCWPMAEMPLRELQVVAGQTAQMDLYFAILPHSWSGCTVSCQGTAPWMQVTPVLGRERSWYTVSLTVDTEGLPAGTHRGWVQVDSDDCRACTEVVLEVLEATGVPSQDASISWSRIKSLYR